MNKKFLLASLLFFCSFIISAQDTIMKTSGSRLIGKVTEINLNSIKYTTGMGSTLKISELDKAEVHSITYANGSKEFYAPLNNEQPVYYDEKPRTERAAPEKPAIYGKNIFAVNLFEICFTNFSCSYERMAADGKYSVKIPVSFGLGGKPVIHDYGQGSASTDFLQNKNYGVGVEFNVYPYGNTRHTFYVGLSGETGSFNYYSYHLYNNNGYTYASSFEKHVGIHYSGMIHIGGYIGLSDNFLLGGKIGMGFKREETIIQDYTRPRAQLDVNMAYRF
jgi:hypothetical protein